MDKGHLILTLNTGSSSLKFSVFEKELCVLRGEVENIGTSQCLVWSKGKVELLYKKEIKAHFQAVKEIKVICEKGSITSFKAVAHRFVFGGDKNIKPTKLTSKILRDIDRYKYVAPLHIPKEIKVVRSVEALFPNRVQVACFDTNFHASIQGAAKELPIGKPYGKNIHRFGFHGLSYEYISSSLPKNKKNIIVAHLGSGTSLCAMKNRKSFDTTMGFSPLGGVMMGTRPGDMDPGVILFLLKQEKLTPGKLEHFLNFECGLKGVSNLSSDMKQLLKASKQGSRVKLAIDMYCYQIAKQIGAYFVALQGIDALVFTGGIGCRSYEVRKTICSHLKSLGIDIDLQKNRLGKEIISTSSSQITTFVIETNEEAMMLKHTLSLLRM